MVKSPTRFKSDGLVDIFKGKMYSRWLYKHLNGVLSLSVTSPKNISPHAFSCLSKKHLPKTIVLIHVLDTRKAQELIDGMYCLLIRFKWYRWNVRYLPKVQYLNIADLRAYCCLTSTHDHPPAT